MRSYPRDAAAGKHGNAGSEGRCAVTEVVEQLRLVDAELAELRRTAAEVRTQVGERLAGPMDPAESASAITAAEEQEALIDVLEQRRDRLLRRLNPS